MQRGVHGLDNLKPKLSTPSPPNRSNKDQIDAARGLAHCMQRAPHAAPDACPLCKPLDVEPPCLSSVADAAADWSIAAGERGCKDGCCSRAVCGLGFTRVAL
eukprot:TRINITY_DN2453_c0_g1_i3.p1 TRINITY_DN2453_c0_g1~~TRINITY_DN2453_c0_g1_i3.p1  ORF type:complete len:102 (+),score=6.77 TRINITY_DN2453_c0_g1_i3:278-583(+)